MKRDPAAASRVLSTWLGHVPPPLTAKGLDIRVGHPAGECRKRLTTSRSRAHDRRSRAALALVNAQAAGSKTLTAQLVPTGRNSNFNSMVFSLFIAQMSPWSSNRQPFLLIQTFLYRHLTQDSLLHVCLSPSAISKSILLGLVLEWKSRRVERSRDGRTWCQSRPFSIRATVRWHDRSDAGIQFELIPPGRLIRRSRGGDRARAAMKFAPRPLTIRQHLADPPSSDDGCHPPHEP